MMTEMMEFVQQWGPYLSLPVIIAFVTQGLKTKIPFFFTVLGLRILHFIPLILGIFGGFLLPEETWQSQVLLGGALGSLSILLYKIVTVSLARKAKLEERILRRDLDISTLKSKE